METVKHNIVKIYGKRGESWLSERPRRIKQLQLRIEDAGENT
jgi:retron-type reverse transcriptase